MPNPSYPIHQFGFIIADGTVRYLPVEPDDAFLEALERAVLHSQPKPVALVLCYPSNPTALVADLDFYAKVIDFCRIHDIIVLSDLAYSEIYFEGDPPPSILQIPGAKDVAVEFTSLSKTYSMAGWRIGFAAGNTKLIAALARVKSYLDYGAFTPIQVAAAAALNGPQDCVDEARAIYRERRDVLVDGLKKAGWGVPVPTASMYIWAPIPEPFAHLGSVAFSKLLLKHAEVAVSRVSALARTVTTMYASRWSKTPSASARRPATSATCSRTLSARSPKPVMRRRCRSPQNRNVPL